MTLFIPFSSLDWNLFISLVTVSSISYWNRSWVWLFLPSLYLLENQSLNDFVLSESDSKKMIVKDTLFADHIYHLYLNSYTNPYRRQSFIFLYNQLQVYCFLLLWNQLESCWRTILCLFDWGIYSGFLWWYRITIITIWINPQKRIIVMPYDKFFTSWVQIFPFSMMFFIKSNLF